MIHVFYPASKRSINSERSELRENVRVSGEAARSTRVSSRLTSRDSPKWRAYSQATSIHEPI